MSTSSAAAEIDPNPPEPSESTNNLQASELPERSHVFEKRLDDARECWAEGKTKFKSIPLDGADEVDAALVEPLLKAAERDFLIALHHVDFDELSYNFELQDEHRKMVDEVRVPLLVNVATIRFRLGDFAESARRCDEALKYEKDNVKAIYRRGQCKVKTGKLEQAAVDLERCVALAPANAEIRRTLKEVRETIREQGRRADAQWAGVLKREMTSTPSSSAGATPVAFVAEKPSTLVDLILEFFRRVFAFLINLLPHRKTKKQR